tara:strand:- start:2121 stop:2303 length:183 start_codon:yes stop_codon:yes gene_type:complete
MAKITPAQQRMESVATKILNKRSISDLDRAKLEEYKYLNPEQEEWIDEALSLFDIKEPPA